MLQQLPAINNAMQGLGVLVGNQRPFVQFLVRNWPLTAIAGLAIYGKLRQRHRAGDLDTYNAMADVGIILSPLVGIALLNQIAKDAAAAAPAPLLPAAKA